MGPPPSQGKGLKIGLIVGGVVLLLVVLCCGVGIAALLAYEPEDPDPVPRPSPSFSATSASPSPGRTASIEFKKGECVVNEGTDDKPELRKASCGPDTYEILSVIPFTTDESKCDNDPALAAPDHDTWYVFDSPIDAGDFVLCMKSR
ncbi:MAG TPA: hypothetical protein VFX61_09070 [Micromonosporaceae bacterium]|nr:hypothetical protein [Micromonosporaceae bacterium]